MSFIVESFKKIFVDEMPIFLVLFFFLNCSFIYLIYKSKKISCTVKSSTHEYLLYIYASALIYSSILFLFNHYLLYLSKYNSFVLATQIFNLIIFNLCFALMLFESYLHWCKQINGNDCQTVELKVHKFFDEGGKNISVKLYVINITTVILIDSESYFKVFEPISYNHDNVLLYKLYFYIWLSIYFKACINFSAEIINIPIIKKFEHIFLLTIDENMCTCLEEILLNYYDIK